jgi:F-type H+-transporting ATPase subunit b
LAATLRRGSLTSPAPATPTARACETWRKRTWLALILALFTLVALPAFSEAAPPKPAAGEVDPHAVAEGHTTEEHHAESPWQFIGKIFNFSILFGLLFVLLRKPIATYLSNRRLQVREDLMTAARLKEDAARQVAAIDAQLKQLPGELDALRARGRDEIAAEEIRIEEAAAAERERLLEGTRREIDLQLRLARRDLVAHAADLAVHVARERIRSQITDRDQLRLVDRYVSQVRTHE